VLDRHGDELGNADLLLAGELAPELERLRVDAQGEPLILRRRPRPAGSQDHPRRAGLAALIHA
jgi:hypothetical protein